MADMVEKTKTTEARTAYGKTLDTPVSYSYKWNEYPDNDTLVAAKDEMTLDEQRKKRNDERESKARQAALSAALTAAGIVKPDINNDDQVRLREFFKVIMSSKKYTEQQARELAAEQLGVEWAE